jgi:hypothetical protein
VIRLPRNGKQCTRITKRENRNSGEHARRAKEALSRRMPIAAKKVQALHYVAYYF